MMASNEPAGVTGLSAIASIRRFLRPAPRPERCALCNAELSADHSHLIEPTSRRLACACEPCAILFGNQGGQNYRRVPRDVRFLPDFRLDDLTWAALQLPIDLAFLFRSTAAGSLIALYPSPAGATESTLTLEAWQELQEANPILGRFEPDVEGLLVNRLGSAREAYRVGIDQCYRLVGIIRTQWRGLSGGPDVWEEVRRFFEDLKARSS